MQYMDAKSKNITHFKNGYYLVAILMRNVHCRFIRNIFSFHRLIYTFLFIGLVAGAHPLHIYNCYASAVAPNDIFLSIEVESLSLKKVCEIIFNDTGYKILIDERWEGKPITLKLEKVPLAEVLRRIIRLSGIENFALVQDGKDIKIYGFESSNLNNRELINGIVFEEPSEKYSADNIGLELTLAEMKYLQEENEEIQKTIPEDTIMTPPSESGKGMTLRELNALKEAQEKNKKSLPSNTVVTPPSESDKGMTIRELEVLKTSQKINMDNMPKDSIVTPPSESGKGLTLGELEAMKIEKEKEMANKFKNKSQK